ncbi:MAG: alpha/beta hydrolase [Oscillatoriaceae cyanobacterium Prado104]|nr:alpha/beta hydrolase [Oscillatoriaceae cyanobacterium Prado104]
MCCIFKNKGYLFIGGEFDIATTMNQQVLLPNTGHWIGQERPTEVNQLLIEFLTQVA